MAGNLKELTECIACGSKNLFPVLDLKDQPLANSYKKTQDADGDYYPLAINCCNECYHVQLTHSVSPDEMFKDYAYVSGTAKTQLEYFEWFADFVIERFGMTPYNVLDIGCNDGSQLNAFKSRGVSTFGVDPAENLYERSSKEHNVFCGYFTGEEFPDSEFDAVICQNAFAHNENQLDLLKNISKVISDDGLIFATTSQCDMILNGEFDTIYHEHLSFYNVKSIDALCTRAGLTLVDVVKTPVHGMSYIFIISKTRIAPMNIKNLIDVETSKGLYSKETYVKYANRCLENVSNFRAVIEKYKNAGYTVVGYGAPAKGNTLMNFAGIGPDFIIDDNPLKQGLFTPGTSIPIYSSDYLNDKNQNMVFIPLAWNFYTEIKNKIQKSRPLNSDIFVRYFPNIEIEETLMHHPV